MPLGLLILSCPNHRTEAHKQERSPTDHIKVPSFKNLLKRAMVLTCSDIPKPAKIGATRNSGKGGAVA